ncbi:ferritin family protein [Chloroflexota bacterium]
MVTEQDKAIGVLKIAVQMETDGKEFYLKASRGSLNRLGKELLRSLADEEDVHRQKFEEIYEAIRSKQGWPKTPFHPDEGKRLKEVFAKATESNPSKVRVPKSELGAVQTAMTMENKTYDFYIKQSQDAAYDAEKDFYQALAAQEKTHHAILLDYYEYLKNPAAWFVNKEHPSLDGG